MADLVTPIDPNAAADAASVVSTVNRTFPAQHLQKAQSEVLEILATVLMTTPQGVKRIIKRTDMYVELLREELQEVGGRLQIKVQFDQGELAVDSFGQLLAVSLQRLD